MAFIHVQKLVRDEEGNIKSGSACIMESVYVPAKDGENRYHSTHRQKEKLGKVIWLSDDKRIGIFNSPTRGLVEYNADDDGFAEVEPEDPRINERHFFEKPKRHVIFGSSYLILGVIRNSGYMGLLNTLFSSEEEKQRLIAHVVGKLSCNGNKSTLDIRVRNSFMSYIIDSVPIDSLCSDTRFFTMMGDDDIKLKFFRSFINLMRSRLPNFGKGCYVDTTPLPNNIKDNPFNALSSHGTGSVGVMTRLAFVVDIETGLPIWYEIIPGNVLDLQTLRFEMTDVRESLDIEIMDFVLDAGYLTKDIIGFFDSEEAKGKTILARMPAKNGYPFKDLYNETRKQFDNGRYVFERNGHIYFGKKCKIKLFDRETYAYVFLDKNNAVFRFSEWLNDDNVDEFNDMTIKEKTWMGHKYGFFVLVSNVNSTPQDILTKYFGRMIIEVGFKVIKEYLKLLPLCKWTSTTVRGKILCDTICHIIYAKLLEIVKDRSMSVTKLIGNTEGLMCLLQKNGSVLIDPPNKQMKESFSICEVKIPTSFDLDGYVREIGI